MAEPLSWFLIEQGWTVVASSGAEAGEVSAVVGDEDMDIFDGLRVLTQAGEERYVPADRVGRIEQGRVEIAASLHEFESTPADAEPGGAEITRDRDAEL